MRQPRFHVFQDRKGGWVWHLKAANGRIIAQGESHTRKRDAERALNTVIETAVKARPRTAAAIKALSGGV